MGSQNILTLFTWGGEAQHFVSHSLRAGDIDLDERGGRHTYTHARPLTGPLLNDLALILPRNLIRIFVQPQVLIRGLNSNCYFQSQVICFLMCVDRAVNTFNVLVCSVVSFDILRKKHSSGPVECYCDTGFNLSAAGFSLILFGC